MVSFCFAPFRNGSSGLFEVLVLVAEVLGLEKENGGIDDDDDPDEVTAGVEGLLRLVILDGLNLNPGVEAVGAEDLAGWLFVLDANDIDAKGFDFVDSLLLFV